MATRREISKTYAHAYPHDSKPHATGLLDPLAGIPDCTRNHARRAIHTANTRHGPAQDLKRRPVQHHQPAASTSPGLKSDH